MKENRKEKEEAEKYKNMEGKKKIMEVGRLGEKIKKKRMKQSRKEDTRYTYKGRKKKIEE
jgi:hypothetical protein